MTSRFIVGARVAVGLVTLVTVLAMCASPVGAQERAGIVGIVTDSTGAVLPGVTATATSDALQVPSIVAVSDERGEYRMTPLPIGTYTVEYTLPGFRGVRREGIRLTVGFTAKVDAVLEVGALNETVTVSGASPVVDVRSTTAGTTITRETIELLPSSRNGMVSLLAQAPGVRTVRDVGGSSLNAVPTFRVFGQSGEAFTMLEGVWTNSLQASAGQGNYWDYTAVEEASVQTIGKGADVPSRGVAMSAVIKSGGNDFHGSAWGSLSGRRFQSNNIDDELRAVGITSADNVDRRNSYSGDLGGRIVRDKLWFYTSLRRQLNDRIPLNTFQTDGVTPAVAEGSADFVTSKLSYQVTPANRIIGFYARNTKVDTNKIDQFTPYESRGGTDIRSSTAKGEWQRTWGDTLVSTVQFGRFEYHGVDWTYAPQGAVSTLDQQTMRITGTQIDVGEVVEAPRWHTRATLTWYKPNLMAGNHEFKLGVDYASAPFGRLYPMEYPKGGPEGTSTAWVNYQLVFQNGAPFQLVGLNRPANPLVATRYLGLYATDSWTVGQRLTLNLGLRYAHDNGYIPAACSEAALPPAHVAFPAACYPKQQFNVWNSVAPRVFASYSLDEAGKTVLKGGWGRFDHQRQHAPELTAADRQAPAQVRYLWRDPNGDGLYQPGEVNLDVNGPDFVSQSGGSNTVANPDETQPKSDEFSLSLERALLPTVALRVSGVYSRSDVYRTLNQFRPYSAYDVPVTNRDPGPDGVLNTGDDPGTSVTYFEFAPALAGRQFEQFTLVNDPSARQTFKTIDVAVNRRFSGRWGAAASYSATKRGIPVLVGNTESEFNSNVMSGPLNPNAEINTSDDNWEWLAKASGIYSFPYGVLLSANFEHRSGYPWARQVLFRGGSTIPTATLNVEPVGARRLPNTNQLDLRVEKSITMPRGHRLLGRVDVFNVTNANAVLSVVRLSGANFMRPQSIVPPRIMELSFSYQF